MTEIAVDQQSPASSGGWPQWLSRREASQYLREQHGIQFGPAALANAAVKGTGPRFQKDGGRLTSYWRPDVDEWARGRKSRPVTSTSELRDGRDHPRAA